MSRTSTVYYRRRRKDAADRRACYSKTKWRTQEAAQHVITNLRREHPDVFATTVRPYRCGNCKRWHLGHEPTW